MPRRARRSAVLAAILVPAAIGSCVPRTLDGRQIERRLGRELSTELRIEGITAECPEEVEVREGSTFRCIARSPDGSQALAINVTQVDAEGHVTWEIAGTAE